MVVDRVYYLLARISALAAILCVVLAGIARIAPRAAGLAITSYLFLAIIALLLAIFLLLNGAVTISRKEK